jgi:glycosyltransferase involved in cell wall biosynthesis
MRISIVTPCRNSARHIRETVESVLFQSVFKSGRAELEYIVCDGASTDETVPIIREFDAQPIKIISEPDKTMYDALAKGLSLASGDIVGYLNAGDYYHPYAFEVVADIFQNRKVSWVTGFATIYNETGAIVEAVLPYRYRRRLFCCGAYGQSLPFLEQESTFWRRDLQEHLDYRALAGMRYAGDYYLWTKFSERADLCVVEAVLGGFRKHVGQLSENLDAYLAEMRQITRRPNLMDVLVARWDRLLWNAPVPVKKRFNPNQLFRYDHVTRGWL